MAYYHSEGIILRTQDFGENDKLITLLSPLQGKYSCLAKGAKKLNSSFVGKLEPLNQLSLFLARGKNLDILSQVKVIDHNQTLKENLELMAFAFLYLELFENLTIPYEKSSAFYKLLLTLLSGLKKGFAPRLLTCWGEIILLKLSGFFPLMDQCVICKEKPKPPCYFSFKNGGIICAKCRGSEQDAMPLKETTLKLYLFLAQAKPQTLKNRLSPSEEMIVELEDLLNRYIGSILGKSLKSWLFAQALLHPANRLAIIDQ